jgi:protein-S-isoprenylcysteine O-methyltransferase Ste14
VLSPRSAESLPGRPTKSRGAIVRHPIYTGILTGFVGTAIALSQVRGVIAVVLIFLAFWAKLRMEEDWMRSQFGETYAEYAHRTAALVPYLF